MWKEEINLFRKGWLDMLSFFRIERLWMREYVSSFLFFRVSPRWSISPSLLIFLVFRREPLWKVSMNIRVQPTVRCSYVAEENVLRIVLKEVVGESSSSSATESSGDAKPQEVVVYALKVRGVWTIPIIISAALSDIFFLVVVSLADHVPNMISKNSQSRSSKVHISKLWHPPLLLLLQFLRLQVPSHHRDIQLSIIYELPRAPPFF